VPATIEAVAGETVKAVSRMVEDPQPLNTKPMNIAKNTNANRRGFQFMTPPKTRSKFDKTEGDS
jgi:hypothetical protein